MPREAFVLGMMGMVLSAGAIASLIWLAHGWLSRRHGSSALPQSADLMRLEQQVAMLQQTVDAVAVEVERISEGQRFVTRLLADRADSVKLSPGQH